MSDGIHDGNVTSPPLQRDDPRVEAEMLQHTLDLILTAWQWRPITAHSMNARAIEVLRDFHSQAQRDALEEAKLAHVSCDYVLYGPPALCTCGICPDDDSPDAATGCADDARTDTAGWTQEAVSNVLRSPQAGKADEAWRYDEYENMKRQKAALSDPIPAADPLDRAVTYRALIEALNCCHESRYMKPDLIAALERGGTP